MLKLLVFLFPLTQASFGLVQLQTTSKIQQSSIEHVHQFLATPSNWPKIVLSSWHVQGTTTTPLDVGSSVDEIFGLPPVIPLVVKWTCVASDTSRGLLDVRSADGVEGIAKDCRMLFQISQQQDDETVHVDLTVEYEPLNILGILAIPVLSVDNAIALKILLPHALQKTTTPLKDFQRLMGSLYGIAGLAHFADCLVGDSNLLVAAGCLPYAELDVQGKALTLLWCTAGPMAFVCSRVSGCFAIVGLIGYGVVEVACAALVAASFERMDTLMNAVGVQAIVAASWVYSFQKTQKEQT